VPDSIRIDNIDNKGGTINFVVNDGKSANVSKESISIAAVDRYSSPLDCEVMISPWGTGFHRVSLSVTNPMIGQRVFEKYLAFKDEQKAKDLMSFAVSVFNEMKDEAEINFKHSSYIIPQIWMKFSNIEADINYDDVIDSSISKRFNNKQLNGSDSPEPGGWVGRSLSPHWPAHGKGVSSPTIAEIIGVPTQMASSKSGLVSTAAVMRMREPDQMLASKSLVNLISSVFLAS